MCLVIWRGGKVVFSSLSKGIRPHLEAINKLGRDGLRGTVMADKIVGRAAALLMLYSAPAEVHASVITTRAGELLEADHVKVYFLREVPTIKEADGHINCPFEAMVQGTCDPEEAYSAIVSKLKSMK